MSLSEASPEQKEFICFLESNSPDLVRFWDLTNHAIKLAEVESFLPAAPSDQRVMLQFYAMVWFNENHFGFDLAEAVRTLNPEQLAIIQTWIAHPVMP